MNYYSLKQAAAALDVKYNRLWYAVAMKKVGQPSVIAGVKAYSDDQLQMLADHFATQRIRKSEGQ